METNGQKLDRDWRAARINLVVPVHNEEASIGPFLSALGDVVKRNRDLAERLEVTFVDDGSRDGTVAEIRRQRVGWADIRILRFARNFGKEAALTAGLDHANGDAVIPIDVDLQEPPSLIPEMLQLWSEGWDIVYACRRQREADSPAKRVSATLFYKLFNRMAETPIPADASDFRVMDRRVVDAVRMMRERTRFMKGILSWPGFSATGVAFERPARAAGTGKWRPLKLFAFALDGLVSFTTLPLKVWTYIGSSVAGLSFIYAVWVVAQKLIFGIPVPGYASIIVAITLLGGLQLLSLGILGEYVARMFEETKQRPIYVLDGVDDLSAAAVTDTDHGAAHGDATQAGSRSAVG